MIRYTNPGMDVDKAWLQQQENLLCVVQTMNCTVIVFLHPDKGRSSPRNNFLFKYLRWKRSGSVSLCLGTWPSVEN